MRCIGCGGAVSDRAAAIVEREELWAAVHGPCLQSIGSTTRVLVDGFSTPLFPGGSSRQAIGSTRTAPAAGGSSG